MSSPSSFTCTRRPAGFVVMRWSGYFFHPGPLLALMEFSFQYRGSVSRAAQTLRAEFTARLSARHRDRDDREGIPGGPGVPHRHGACGAEDNAHGAERQSVPHGPIGREPRRDVAARDPVDDTISQGEQEERIAHPLAPGREDAGRVQRYVGGGGKNEDRKQAGEHGADSTRNVAGGRRCFRSFSGIHGDGSLGFVLGQDQIGNQALPDRVPPSPASAREFASERSSTALRSAA